MNLRSFKNIILIAGIPLEALGFAKGHACDLVITDVDMGPHSLNGFELVQELRAIGLKALICIHSNRAVAENHLMGFNSGADAFLPKPIARAQLLRLVLQAAHREIIHRLNDPSDPTNARERLPKKSLFYLAPHLPNPNSIS